MIAVRRLPAPELLNTTEVVRLTGRYLATRSDVWNADAIRHVLMEMSHGKCVYCECRLGEESKYMEVDHFHYKKGYPEMVVEWENLLPSCKRCNLAKLEHDVVATPIINPTCMSPGAHLSLSNYRLRGKDAIGCATVTELDLNNTTRCVVPRFNIGEKVEQSIETITGAMARYEENRSTRTRNIVSNGVTNILREALPTAEYSATVATIICSSADFECLINAMRARGLWSEEMEIDFIIARESVLR